jgi:hypothetical protein
VAKLGRPSLGGPVVANGLVWVGTNNSNPREPASTKDASVLMCFRESDGKFLWQYVSPRLREYDQDGPLHSMGSTPLIEGDRLWLITNRCETLCLDVGPLRHGEGPPKEVWKTDMRKEFGVYPHAPLMGAGLSPSPAADTDRVFAVTGNGVDETSVRLPAPQAPSLICFNKKTGQALWKDASPGKDILHAQRSSPLIIGMEGRTQVVVGQGDGWLRSFDAGTGKPIWKCDLNPKGAKYMLGEPSTKIFPPATATDGTPSPSPLAFHSSGGPPSGHSFRSPVSVETFVRSGPRHCGQCPPGSGGESATACGADSPANAASSRRRAVQRDMALSLRESAWRQSGHFWPRIA